MGTRASLARDGSSQTAVPITWKVMIMSVALDAATDTRRPLACSSILTPMMPVGAERGGLSGHVAHGFLARVVDALREVPELLV